MSGHCTTHPTARTISPMYCLFVAVLAAIVVVTASSEADGGVAQQPPLDGSISAACFVRGADGATVRLVACTDPEALNATDATAVDDAAVLYACAARVWSRFQAVGGPVFKTRADCSTACPDRVQRRLGEAVAWACVGAWQFVGYDSDGDGAPDELDGMPLYEGGPGRVDDILYEWTVYEPAGDEHADAVGYLTFGSIVIAVHFLTVFYNVFGELSTGHYTDAAWTLWVGRLLVVPVFAITYLCSLGTLWRVYPSVTAAFLICAQVSLCGTLAARSLARARGQSQPAWGDMLLDAIRIISISVTVYNGSYIRGFSAPTPPMYIAYHAVCAVLWAMSVAWDGVAIARAVWGVSVHEKCD